MGDTTLPIFTANLQVYLEVRIVFCTHKCQNKALWYCMTFYLWEYQNYYKSKKKRKRKKEKEKTKKKV